MTAWSLFGMQRIIAWEAPLMGVALRGGADGLEPGLPDPRRWLVTLYFHER
jgi:hypothetical protein